MKKLGVLLVLIGIIGNVTHGQMYKPKKRKKDFFRNERLSKPLYKWVTGDYSRHGIQFSFGPTYMFTPLKPAQHTYTSPSDSTYEITREDAGRIGIFAELGMVHIINRPNKFIHYFDWGIGFKLVGGKETTQAQLYDFRDSLVGDANGKGEFYNGYLYGRFDAHSVYQINPYLFLDNSLGVNVDYMIMPGDMAYSGFNYSTNQQFQGEWVAQLHYSLGLGIRPNVRKGFYFVPSIEIPILGAYEWRGGTPQIHWFSSKYFPAMLRLKFVWLFKKGESCPTVETNQADKERSREFQQHR